MIPGVFGVAACSSRSRHDGAVSTLDCLLVGTFHMANPSADMVNLQADDVLAPARQREIEAIVVGLERFRPTKVLLEHPRDDSSVIRRYREYRDGSRALGRTETEQLGFRLAAACGHEQVHPVDVVDKFYEDRIEELIVESKYAASWRELRSATERSVGDLAAVLRDCTVGDALRFANSPEQRRAMLIPTSTHSSRSLGLPAGQVTRRATVRRANSCSSIATIWRPARGTTASSSSRLQ